MARPRNDPGDSFGPSDLASAAGLTVRNYELTVERGFISRNRDVAALKRAAVLGGLVRAGLPVLLAARVAQVVADGMFQRPDGEVPARLDSYLGKLPEKMHPDNLNDYWVHRSLCDAEELGLEGFPHRCGFRGDVLVEVVDRRLVITDALDFPAPDPLARIEGLGTEEFVVVPWWMEPPEDVESGGPSRVEEFSLARKNAVSRVIINASLAIRNALDDVRAYRAARLRPKAPHEPGGGANG